METVKHFRELELGRLCHTVARIKIKTDSAETKWIDLTCQEFEKIKEVLCQP